MNIFGRPIPNWPVSLTGCGERLPEAPLDGGSSLLSPQQNRLAAILLSYSFQAALHLHSPVRIGGKMSMSRGGGGYQHSAQIDMSHPHISEIGKTSGARLLPQCDAKRDREDVI